MSWIALTLTSAVLLGIYDIAKKQSVRGNAVPVVLLCNVATAAAIWLIPVVVAGLANIGWVTLSADWHSQQLISLSLREHGLVLLKSVLVGCSWTTAFFALKHLPISIAAPIRATSPLWTIALAVLVMGERPSGPQWLGIAVVLTAFVAFSLVGAKEGIHFHRDRWVLLTIIATLTGSASALYDKFLLQQVAIPPAALQAWFSVYLVPVMLPLSVRWYVRDRTSVPFEWRPTIPLIAIFLLAADFTYFHALADPEALVAIISPIRRTSIVIPFAYGIVHLSEANWRLKAACVAATLVGAVLLSLTAA